jgi:putative phosphoesterase|tara:strand:+ start:599 stop:1294 length:696 start_codon:yes stop_codon:yes gene_type:complete
MKIAFISDIHSNIFALNSVYEDLNTEKVERIFIAGDLIGYYYWPKDVIDLIRSDDRFLCIAGNHEKILNQVISSNEEAEKYKKKLGSGYQYCIEQLSNNDIDWLSNLPDELSVSFDDKSIFIKHGNLNSINTYLYPDEQREKILANYSDSKVTVFGHSHYPFIHSNNNRYIINPGSVGQPRDVGGLASYVVYNTDNDAVRFKRLPFDTKKVIDAVESIDPEHSYLKDIMKR